MDGDGDGVVDDVEITRVSSPGKTPDQDRKTYFSQRMASSLFPMNANITYLEMVHLPQSRQAQDSRLSDSPPKDAAEMRDCETVK